MYLYHTLSYLTMLIILHQHSLPEHDKKIEEEADQAEVRRWEGKGEAQDRLS